MTEQAEQFDERDEIEAGEAAATADAGAEAAAGGGPALDEERGRPPQR